MCLYMHGCAYMCMCVCVNEEESVMKEATDSQRENE